MSILSCSILQPIKTLLTNQLKAMNMLNRHLHKASREVIILHGKEYLRHQFIKSIHRTACVFLSPTCLIMSHTHITYH